MIAEFREWKHRFALRNFIVLSSLIGITLLISKMQFIDFFLVIALFFMWLGWQDGSQRWNDVKFSRVRNTKNVNYAQWFGGKYLGFLLLSLIHGILLVPMFFLTVLLWGMPVSQCLAALGIGIATGVITLTLWLLTQWINPIFGTFISVIAIMFWLFSGYFLPFMAPVNPLILNVNLVNTGNFAPSLAYIAGCFALQTVLITIMQLFSQKTKKEIQ